MKKCLSFLFLCAFSAFVAAAPPSSDSPVLPASIDAKAFAKLFPAEAPMPREKVAVACCGLDPFVRAADGADAPKFHRGHKHATDEKKKARHDAAFDRHGHRVKHLPIATGAAFDIDTLGWGTPIRDQGNCGSCWNVSACDVLTAAYVKAGQAKGDGSFEFSPQYVMDCEDTGGCNGDDAPHVLQIAKDKGIPSEADYGPYTASSNRCKYTNQKRYKIADFLYATPSQQSGMAATQDIKNVLVAYGQVSTAIVADSSWDNVGADGVIRYERSNPNSVDHDVSITGWDDNKQIPGAPTKGAWKVKNQWSGNWGAGGYCWIAYGSHQIGTEAAAVVVSALPPPPVPPGPPPVPPTPTPVPPSPVPPSPTPTPGSLGAVIVDPTTGTITATGPWKLKGTSAIPSLAAELLEAGVPQPVIDAVLILIDATKKSPAKQKSMVPRRNAAIGEFALSV